MGEGGDEIQDDVRVDNDLSQHSSKTRLSSPKRSWQTDYFILKIGLSGNANSCLIVILLGEGYYHGPFLDNGKQKMTLINVCVCGGVMVWLRVRSSRRGSDPLQRDRARQMIRLPGPLSDSCSSWGESCSQILAPLFHYGEMLCAGRERGCHMAPGVITHPGAGSSPSSCQPNMLMITSKSAKSEPLQARSKAQSPGQDPRLSRKMLPAERTLGGGGQQAPLPWKGLVQLPAGCLAYMVQF